MTAKDLLLKLVDYSYHWSEYRSKEKPAVHRFKQIEALQKAFGLTKEQAKPVKTDKKNFWGRSRFTSVKDFDRFDDYQFLISGSFTHFRQQDENAEIINRIAAFVQEHYNMSREKALKKLDINWLFNSLFIYRTDVQGIVSPDPGMLEGFSPGLQYSLYMQHQFKQKTLESLSEIDDTLWLILDPERRDIPKDTLISQFNYPDIDLKSIDLDWHMENY